MFTVQLPIILQYAFNREDESSDRNSEEEESSDDGEPNGKPFKVKLVCSVLVALFPGLPL